MNPWDKYIGKTRERDECVGHKDLSGLASLLDYDVSTFRGGVDSPWPENVAPPFAHWLNGNPHARQSELGADGHPQKGTFLPNLPYPRRMWAGSKVQLLQDYSPGQALLHRETIKSIEHKSGRSGEMVFVTLQHEYYCDGKPVIFEQQDLVYRAAGEERSQEVEVRAQPLDEVELLECYEFDWQRRVQPDPVLLFRYSAVTFNGHRIHYDREYATRVEHYPGLVVHGPLTATLLIDLYQRNNPGQRVIEFTFKGIRPLFDTDPFILMGKETGSGAELWALDCRGQQAMQMTLLTQ